MTNEEMLAVIRVDTVGILELLEMLKEPVCYKHNGFIDLHEDQFMNDEDYRRLQFGKNGYVANLIEGPL